MGNIKKIGMLLAFFFVCLTIKSDLRGPFIQTDVPECPSDMTQVVVYANDYKGVTLRLLALDGSNAEYTIVTRGGETSMAPFVYFITNGSYKILEMTDGYTAYSSLGILSVGMTIEFTGGSGYISYYVE